MHTVREAAKQFGKAANGELDEPTAAMWQNKLLNLYKSMQTDRDRQPTELPYIPGYKEYDIIDWIKAPIGMLVTRSDHWYKERRRTKPNEKEIGILTDKSFSQDGKGRVIAHPSIWWANELHSSINHPMNVTPYHDNHGLPMTKMDDGQWGTNGPTNNKD